MDDPKTRIVRRHLDIQGGPEPNLPPDPDRTRKVSQDEPTRTVDERLHPPLAPQQSTMPLKPPQPAESSTTKVLWRPQRKSGESGGFDPLDEGTRRENQQDASNDPVVGWLVVVKGPGRGNFVRLGYGMNTIGRDASQRACLNFGDEGISRLNHARLFYDPRARRFAIAPGDGVNLTYVVSPGGTSEALMTPTELQTGFTLQMGETELRFVPLCGPDFDWQDAI